MSAMRPILIVEDDEDLVACLRAVLENGRRSVVAVRDGVSALAEARHRPFMALVDLHIAGELTGAELVRRLREQLAPGTRLILLSAERDLSLRAHELGADGSLEKPFDIDDLLRLVEEEERRAAEPDPVVHP
jgi:CheY-like chemotaxis protein